VAFPVQVAFRNMEPAKLLERLIRDQAEKLERAHKQIAGCRVLVARRHRQDDAGGPLHVRVDLTVSEDAPLEIDVIDRDAYLASIEAFRLARIRLDVRSRSKRAGERATASAAGGTRGVI